MKTIVRLWGDTEQTAKIAKESLERKIEELLKERKQINLKDLYSEFWHGHHLLNHYLQIFLMVKELEDEGKLVIDEEKNITMTKVTFLDYETIKEVSVWDLEHKKEDIKKKKEIIERYQTINYLA